MSIMVTQCFYMGTLMVYFLRMYRIYKVFTCYNNYLLDQKSIVGKGLTGKSGDHSPSSFMSSTFSRSQQSQLNSFYSSFHLVNTVDRVR